MYNKENLNPESRGDSVKKVKSINELMYESLFILFPIWMISFLLFVRYIINLLAFQIISLIILVILMIFLVLVNFIWGKELPLQCKRSPYGFVEFHVGKKCKSNAFFFIKNCIELTLIAIGEKRDVLIDTWLISRNNITKHFGDSAEFLEPSLIQKLVNSRNEKKYTGKDNRKSYRCIIHVDKLSHDQINVLKDKKDMLERRMNKVNDEQ